MNILNITKSLHERINSATSLDEILILTKTIERLNLGTVKTVSNYSDLLLEYPREGEVYFVENEEQLYYGFNGLWYLILRTATTLAYGWGFNNLGQLGDNTTTPLSRSSPVSVVGGFTDWTRVTGGFAHSIGIRANGTLWSWGYNFYGQLGDNTTTRSRSSPVSVVGGFTDWIALSCGDSHAIGLRANGTTWGWGINVFGNLGDNTVTSRRSPVSVVGGFTDWVAVSCGFMHSIGLRANSTLWAWGYNLRGQLGNNTTSNRSSPVSVVGGFTDWIAASGGFLHSIGLRANGTAWTWGRNDYGQLGDNTIVSKSSPVSVVGGFTDWTAVAAAGHHHNLGLRANGTMWGWGRNNAGQLGDGTTSNRSSPVSVVGGFTDWISMSAGVYQSIGLRANGTLWAWGGNGLGQLGDGTFTSRLSPVSTVGGFTDWISASAAMRHTLGIRSTT